MRQIILLLLSVVLLTPSCRKNKPKNPVDELPPETQTGANTFGCLVNGEVFNPGGAQLSGGSLNCSYQIVNNAYYFVLVGRFRNNSNGSGSSVAVFTDSLNITEGEKFKLKVRALGQPSGSYISYTSGSALQQYATDGSIHRGELWIKKLDPFNQIVSGTFWFDAVNDNGQKVEVREGRFDVRYTQ